jgi:hypothetical protein
MNQSARHDRTVRLLAARLEEMAVATERRPALDVEPRVLGALAATRHAVALGLLAGDEADAIWAAVADRHPCARWAHRRSLAAA